MNYIDHPLLSLSALNHKGNQPYEDLAAKHDLNVRRRPLKERIKRSIGFYLYPLKNKIEKKQLLKQLTFLSEKHIPQKLADVITKGQKGSAVEIFLAKVNKLINKKPDVVLIYGCGTGEEVFDIAKYLQPGKIIAIDYFNYSSIWKSVTEQVKRKYKIDIEFMQVDFNNPQSRLFESADIIYSQAVLEHLRDMNKIFEQLQEFLKKDGYFASQWGPMWYSYSGDHISAELGHEMGFEHLLLNSEQYFDYYKSHPRNKPSIAAGEKTWLELGLHNFATYAEYIESLQKYFGNIEFLHWVVSKEAISYREKFPAKWNKILKLYPFISGFDLMVPCAGILLKNKN